MAPVASEKTIPQDQAFLDLLEVAKHTLTITQNKSFYIKPLKTGMEVLSVDDGTNQMKNMIVLYQRHPLADKIDQIACSAYEKARHSRNYEIEDKADLDHVKRLQKDALKSLDTLIIMMQLAKAVFHLSAKKFEHWTGIVLKAESSYREYCMAVQKAQLRKISPDRQECR